MCQIRVSDCDGNPKYANVLIKGVPLTGVLDTGVDSINVFKVAATARMGKKLQQDDKVPCSYIKELDG